MSELYCICGARVDSHTGGYSCPKCFRQYSVSKNLINKGANHIIEFCEKASRSDNKTMQYDKDE